MWQYDVEYDAEYDAEYEYLTICIVRTQEIYLETSFCKKLDYCCKDKCVAVDILNLVRVECMRKNIDVADVVATRLGIILFSFFHAHPFLPEGVYI